MIKELAELFSARKDVYAECYYDKKQRRYAYKSIKKPLTDKIIKSHIEDPNFQGIGIYPLLEGNKTKWIAADFDFHTPEEREELQLALKTMRFVADEIGLHFYTEISKSGNGVHLWIFFSEEIDSWKARKLMGGFLLACKADQLSSMDRFFPSQDRLYETSKGFGNLIHMPFSSAFDDKGTFFVDEDEKKLYGANMSDVELFIENVDRHTPEFVDTILDKWGLLHSVEASAVYEHDNIEYEYAPDGILHVLSDPFIRWCKDNAGQVDYNAWIALVTNLIPFGDDGVKAIHDISSLDPKRYDREATTQKIIACQGMKPITYNWIQKNTNYKEVTEASYKSPAVAGIKRTGIQSPVYEAQGRYWIKMARANKEISTWVAEPVHIVKINDTISRVWNIVSEDKIIKDVSFSPEDISSLPAFKRRIMSLYHKLLWYGAEVELMRVLDYINQNYPKLPTVNGVDKVGMIQDPLTKNWIVLTQLCAWDKNTSRNDYIYFNPSSKKEITFSPEATISVNELENIRKYMWRFNELSVCATIWGWMASIFIKQRLYEMHSVRFPVLMIHGQAGSGKSESARHVIQPFFGDVSPMLRVDDITSFAFTALGSSTNMFPLIYDEYKPALFDNSKVKMISKMIRGLYDNESAVRGQKDLSTREFKIFAPAVIIGEMGFEETALRERSVDVFVNKNEGYQYLEFFLKLAKLPIAKFGNALLNWSLTLSDDELFKMFSANIKGNGRVVHNIAMVNTGLDLIKRFFSEYKIEFNNDALKETVYEYQMEAQTVAGETRSAVDNILEGIIVMHQSELLTETMIDNDFDETELFLHTPTIYPRFKKWARETNFDGEVISHNEFVKQLKKMQYYKGTKAMRMGGDESKSVKKVRILDINVLKEKKIFE